MSEERRKILEMLSEGKITVDEAERLLRAVGEEAGAQGAAPAGEDKEGDDGEAEFDLDDLERQIRARVDGVRHTVRASMPRLRSVIRDRAPDVERIVEQATAHIPSLVEEMTRVIRGAFGEGRDQGGEDRFPSQVERDFVAEADVQPGSRLVLHNPRGRLEVETWDAEKVCAEVHLTVRSRDQETAQRCAESVQLAVEPGDGQLLLRPVFPGGQEDASYRLDVRLRLPRRLHLDVRTSHGDLAVPEMDGDLVLGGDHNDIRLAGTSGAAAIQHDHGSVQVGRVAGRFALNAHHSHLELDEVVAEASLDAHHGRLRLRRVGGNLLLNSHHAPLEMDEVHGNAVANNHHGPLILRQILGDLTLNSSHSPVQIGSVGGSARLASNHGPVNVERVEGELSAQNSHGPVCVGSVGRGAAVRNSFGPIDLGRVGGEVTVESDRGPVHLGSAGGRVTVRASRADVLIEDPAGEVLAENSRGAITVRPSAPVQAAYTLTNSRGNISVELPDGSGVGVQGFVRRGRVETDLPLEVSANGQQGQSVSGQLGRGGAALQVEIDDGNLMLRRRPLA